QAGVARRQRQAVGVSHYRYDVDLQVKIQITDDLLDHGDLLRVLLPEERDMGLDGREELHADRRDAAEVPWPAFAFEPDRRTLDVDPRAESGWIQLFDGRRKDDVDAGSRGSLGVLRFVSRVCGIVLRVAELRGIDEDAGDDDVRCFPGRVEQRNVARVEGAHGRDETNPAHRRT